MQRAYDQIIHDVALQNLSVIFCLDRGGIVGEDGATHHGVYDLAFLRCIPNMIIASPMNEIELRNMLYTAQLRNQGPFTIRYPRGNGVLMDWQKPFEELPIGKGRLINEGNDLAILSIGPIGNFAKEAISILKNEGYSIALYDLRFVKPIDHDLLMNVCKKFENIITIEDGTIIGGMGSAVIEFIADNGFKTNVKRLGVPDRFVEHGTQNQLYHECGYYIDDIIKTVKEVLTKKSIKQII